MNKPTDTSVSDDDDMSSQYDVLSEVKHAAFIHVISHTLLFISVFACFCQLSLGDDFVAYLSIALLLSLHPLPLPPHKTFPIPICHVNDSHR